MIKCCHDNILETGAVSLQAGAAHADYPLYRLYDRNTGRPFMAASAQTLEIKIDRGAADLSQVDRLIIPKGHNLSGMTLSVLLSDDDAAYTPAVPQWVQADGGLIEKSWPPETGRFWKFVVTNPPEAPRITELFLTAAYEWEKDPARPSRLGAVFNVERDGTAGGEARFLIKGEPQRKRTYAVKGAWEAQKKNILALNDSWRGAMPFFLRDHEGEWIFGGLEKAIEIIETGFEEYSFAFDFVEMTG